MTTHLDGIHQPTAATRKTPGEVLSNITVQAFFPLEIWRLGLLLPRAPRSSPPSHGDSLGLREQTFPLASP